MELEVTKDPDARLDYAWDWTEWLDGDTIVDHEIKFDPTENVTLDDSVRNTENTMVVAWITGGVLKTSVDVTCHIVTAAGRSDDRTMSLWIDQR